MPLFSARSRPGKPGDSDRSGPPQASTTSAVRPHDTEASGSAPMSRAAGTSALAMAANIAADEARRANAVKLPVKLSLAKLVGDSTAAKLKELNEEAELELQLQLQQHEQQREAIGHMQPADDASAGQVAALAYQHLAEGLRRFCANGARSACAAVDDAGDWARRTCCLQPLRRHGRLQPGGRLPVGGESDMAPGQSTARRLPPADKALLSGGEGDVDEAHLVRVRKKKLGGHNEEEALKAAAFKETHILEDKANKAASDKFLWCPTHVSRQGWDLAMLVLILYSCFVVPFRLGMDAPAEGGYADFDRFVTVAFITDLFLNFNTAFTEGQYVVIDRCEIAKTYVRGWFWIDFFSSFPYETASDWMGDLMHPESAGIEDTQPSSLKMLRIFRLIRLLRLLRLLKLQQYIDAIEDRTALDLQVLNIVKMVTGLLYLMHVLGCGWFWVANFSESDVTWLSSYDDGSGLAENGADTSVQYLYAVYWALTTLTTVGYGDIIPTNDVERAYALASLLVGALVFGYMLSAISDLVSSLDKQGTVVQERLADVKEFTRWHKMSPTLTAKVRKYYEYNYSKQGPMDQATSDRIMSTFAPALERDVMAHLLGQSVCRIPFFYVPALGKDADGSRSPPADIDFQLAIYPLLRTIVREAKEVIIHKGERGGDLHFLERGQLHALGDLHSHGAPRLLYAPNETGAFISEHVLSDAPCDVHYVAHQRCEFFCLDPKALLALLDSFPQALNELAHFAAAEMIDHKRQRVWSLRFAQAEKIRTGLSPGEHEAQLRRRTALKLQVPWLKRMLHAFEARAAAGEHAAMLPVLHGAVPKMELEALRRRRQRRAGATRSSSPVGGESTSAAPPRPIPLKAAATAAPAVVLEPAMEEAMLSPTPTSERLRALRMEFEAVEQKMAARDQQLDAVLERLGRAQKDSKDGKSA